MYSYVIDLALLLSNSLGLGLHQISYFLVQCINKLNSMCFRLGLMLFYTWYVFAKHVYICSMSISSFMQMMDRSLKISL